LVADGGSENHSITVQKLLESSKNPEIHKIIARKDITFSNSPIEAINKIMKHYLRSHKPDNLEDLQLLLPKIISDYQHQRPHGSLKGLIPTNNQNVIQKNQI
jgi:putative transposase